MKNIFDFVKVEKNESLFIQNENDIVILYIKNNDSTIFYKCYETFIKAKFKGCLYIVNSKKFLSIAKNTNIEYIEQIEDGLIKLNTGFTSEVTISDCINLTIPNDCNFKLITTDTLKKLKINEKFTLKDNNRYYLKYFNFEKNKIYATDACIASILLNDFYTDEAFNILPSIFNILGHKELVLIGVTEDKIILKNSFVTIYQNKPDIQFPNCERVIPDIFKYIHNDIDLSIFNNKNKMDLIKSVSENSKKPSIDINDGVIYSNNVKIGEIGNVLNNYRINAIYLKNVYNLLGDNITCYYHDKINEPVKYDKSIYFENQNNDIVVMMPMAK